MLQYPRDEEEDRGPKRRHRRGPPDDDDPAQCVEDHRFVIKKAARLLMDRLEMRTASTVPEYVSWALALMRLDRMLAH